MNLKEARFRKGMTQIKLQSLSRVSQCRISMVENGWITLNDDEKNRIEKALGRVGEISWDEPYSFSKKMENPCLQNRTSCNVAMD